MAAIAATQVSIFGSGTVPPAWPATIPGQRYVGGNCPEEVVEMILKLTGVTAGDTATAAVLGFSAILGADSGYDATGLIVVPLGVDYVDNQLLIGAGPANTTVYLRITGSPATIPTGQIL
jgi:hypothetical protein